MNYERLTIGLRAKILLTLGLILVGLGALLITQSWNVGKLRIIACDVGQGDGLLIITPGGKQIVVDGGPGRKIEECLSAHMPFWDRTIEMVLNTHPQQDHLEGLVGVLANYKVQMIATTGVVNEIALFKEWQKAVDSESSKVYTPRAGDRLVLDSKQGRTLSMDVLWPSSAKASEWQAAVPKELNETSVVFRLSYGQFCGYFTGDIPKEILENLIDKKCQVLKVAHHGSKTGTSEKILDEVGPRLAIIQVGKNNRYGHPHKEVIDMFASKGVKTVRTDTNGVIEIESDGASYLIKSERQSSWVKLVL